MSSARMMTMLGLETSAAPAASAPSSVESGIKNLFHQFFFVLITTRSILNIGKLLVIVEAFFEPIKFVGQFLFRRGVGVIVIDIAQFVRVLLQNKQLPLIDAIKINQFVTGGSHAVMRLNPVIGRVMVIAIIHR